MINVQEMHIQYVLDAKGQKSAVILPLSEFEALIEDLQDLAEIAKRVDEDSISHDELKENLSRDGYL